MNAKRKRYRNHASTDNDTAKAVDEAVEKYIADNEEIKLAKEAMNRSQMIKERRIASLLKRSSYLRIQ